MKKDVQGRKVLYATVWRWHFYAGLYVAPFLVLLALTGLVMLAKEPIERWQLGTLVTNTSGGTPASHQARLDAARLAFPTATFVRYQPGRNSADATSVTVTLDGRPHTVFVDASTGLVRGIVDDGHRIGVVAELVHGTLLMGVWGDRLIEIAASFGILLIVSGVYLWFPKGTSFWQALRVTGGTRRLAWRDLHKTTGAVLAPVLAFYFISGLAWTGVWGERFVQTWSTLAATNAAPADATSHTHDTLNAASSKVVPWNLEQTPLPSSSHAGHGLITLDAAIAAAQREGIGQRFFVGVPGDADGVWTIAQTGLNDDINDPRQELTVHVDQYTGRVVGDGGWEEYSPMARAMAAGIPLHMGSLGWWNLLGASVVCLSVITLSLSGLVMWWLR
ncbi:MAG: PepSY domain-containing protein, partial [Vicinamibacterales bacterium]